MLLNWQFPLKRMSLCIPEWLVMPLINVKNWYKYLVDYIFMVSEETVYDHFEDDMTFTLWEGRWFIVNYRRFTLCHFIICRTLSLVTLWSHPSVWEAWSLSYSVSVLHSELRCIFCMYYVPMTICQSVWFDTSCQVTRLMSISSVMCPYFSRVKTVKRCNLGNSKNPHRCRINYRHLLPVTSQSCGGMR